MPASTSATDSLVRAPADSSYARGSARPEGRSLHRMRGLAALGSSGRGAFDDALRALGHGSTRFQRLPVARPRLRCGRRPILMGCPIETPSVRAPRRAAFSSAREACCEPADASVEAAPESTLQVQGRRRLVKDSAAGLHQGAFHRRMFARRRVETTRNLEREPATSRRLCRPRSASDALSRLRLKALDTAACSGSSPGRARQPLARLPITMPRDVRRLLPSIRIDKHGLRIRDTRAGARGPKAARQTAVVRVCPAHVNERVRRGTSRTSSGQGSRVTAGDPLSGHPPAAMARDGGFAPTRARLGHLVSRRRMSIGMEMPIDDLRCASEPRR